MGEKLTLTYAYLSYCRLFIGNDSGLMHLAAASGILINGADKFTYNLGGNILTGDKGKDMTFSELGEFWGIDSLRIGFYGIYA